MSSACPHGCPALTSLWGFSGTGCWVDRCSGPWCWGWIRIGLLQCAQSSAQGLFPALPECVLGQLESHRQHLAGSAAARHHGSASLSLAPASFASAWLGLQKETWVPCAKDFLQSWCGVESTGLLLQQIPRQGLCP